MHLFPTYPGSQDTRCLAKGLPTCPRLWFQSEGCVGGRWTWAQEGLGRNQLVPMCGLAVVSLAHHQAGRICRCSVPCLVLGRVLIPPLSTWVALASSHYLISLMTRVLWLAAF